MKRAKANRRVGFRLPVSLIICAVLSAATAVYYAGFRTLDSIVRARRVFCLSRCTIISENYHCPRALWIARQEGLNAIAFAAPDVRLKSWSWRAEARERLARSWCAVDPVSPASRTEISRAEKADPHHESQDAAL